MLYRDVLSSKPSLRFPFRLAINAFYAFISSARTAKPIAMKIENTTICNLRCKMCPLQVGLKRKIGSLSFKNFKYVFDQVKPCYLNLTGIGEPITNSNIFQIIKYARKKGAFVKLDTNGILLTEEYANKMLNANPNILSFSIDGGTKETYEKIRIGAKFDILIKNLKYMVKRRNELKSKTQLHTFMVAQKDNMHEIPDYIKMMIEIGIDAIKGSFVISLGGNENLKNRMEKVDSEKAKKVLNEILELNKKYPGKLEMDNIIDHLKNFDKISKGEMILNSDKPCFMPWYIPYVTWDGYVCPCTFFSDNEVVYGNVFEQPFMKIWNSKEAQEFRKQLLKKRVGICEGCSMDETFIYDKLKIFAKIPFFKLLSYRKWNTQK